MIKYNTTSSFLIATLDTESLFHRGEFEKPRLNFYIKTVEEFQAPLLNKNSAIYREGLRLVSLETKVVPCPCQVELQKRGASGTCSFFITSLNGNIFRVSGPLCGEFTGEFPSQRPVTRGFDVFFDLRLDKRLSKQSRRRWLETS